MNVCQLSDRKLTYIHTRPAHTALLMPSFEALILSSPTVFIKACKKLNTLLESHTDEAISLISQSIAHFKPVQGRDIDVTVHIDQDVLYVVSHIISSLKLVSQPLETSRIAAILDSYSYLSRQAIEAIVMGIDNNVATDNIIPEKVKV